MASQTFQLVMGIGPNPGKTFNLEGDEISIGRDIGNNIVINDPEVSRKHALITAQAGGYVIEDLGSTNGTFVNGQRLTGLHVLQPGATIMLGEKVSLACEIVGYDPDATLVGASAAQPSPPPTPETYRIPTPPEDEFPAPPQPDEYPAPVPQTEVVPAPPDYQPAFSGQVPPGPPEPEPYTPPPEFPFDPELYGAPVEEQETKSRTWIYIGCGCLIVILCLCVGGFAIFDTLNLYCEEPFRAITEFLGAQCP